MTIRNLIGCGLVAVVSIVGSAHAQWAGYRSGLVNVINDPGAGWTYPNYKYETFSQSAGNIGSGGVLSQTVTTNYDDRAVWFSYGYTGGSNLGASGLASLSADVSVTGSALQRLIQDPSDGNNVVGTTSGVSLAWYFMYQDGSGNYNVWLSNSANRLDLNAVLAGGSTNFSVALNAANFSPFPGYPQGGASFAQSVAGAQSFGLLITSATASGGDFDGMPITQWIDADGIGWDPYAIQRNGNYGAFSTGSTTIEIANAVPAPGALGLLGAMGLVGRRRRR